MFSKILIANRGEIAVRIIRACKEMGISTVAVFSEADRDALHVSLADESYCIGPAHVSESYLNMQNIIAAAISSGAEALHPGYGLLSESAEFSDQCAKNGVTFIGPAADVITKLGDKNEARKTMKSAGVPVVPGSGLVSGVAQGKREAKKLGYPVVIKARAGGGGKGIRVVETEQDFEQSFQAASSEAKASFGDGKVYIEKYLRSVKHIEMQILADSFGAVVCLGERDCSMQRKKQKLIEESPAECISEETRKHMIEASVKAAKAADYRGAGTIEYLFDGECFYFMEMNTRLQVEHPVTEMVTWIDLVKWQIRIAAGVKLDYEQSDVEVTGHAIECRINAENPH